MRILVITQYYFPEQFRVNEVCEALVAKGHQVTVVTGLPNYPEGEIYPGYIEAYKKEEIIEGVKVLRCNLRPRHSGAINLIINYFSFVWQAKRVLKKLKDDFDVIYVYEISPVTVALPAIYYKKHHRIPIYFYCMDIWPECVRDKGAEEPMSKLNPVFILSRIISNYVYKHVDVIGVKCKQFSEYLYQECDVPREKTMLLYEHAEKSYLGIAEVPISNNCYDFMFLGNLGGSQRCEVLIEAIEGLETNKRVKLHFVGSGSDAEHLAEYVKEKNLEEKVVFHGRHPVSEINDFYNLADCCVYNLSSNTQVGITPPGKLVSYMAAARPIIAGAEGASKDIINDADCGICVSPDNAEEIRRAMQYAIDNTEVFIQKGRNGRQYFVDHFTLNMHIEELEKQLAALVNK